MGKTPSDWHSADVQAALKKAGWTMRQVGAAAGYRHADSASHVLRIPMPRVEAKIGEILKCAPSTIWPSRYRADGQPKSRRQRVTITVKTHGSNADVPRGRAA